MPTYDKLAQFLQDWHRLTPQQRRQFLSALREFVHDLSAGAQFRKGLRVKGVQGYPGVYEMTWASNGRATFEYGDPVLPGEPHIIWRRVGSHAIFKNP